MRMGADGAGRALDAEGDRRFDAKVAHAREAVRASGVEQALCDGLLEALGYGGNAQQMLTLARLLPWTRLRDMTAGDQTRMEALLLGSAGLLPSQRAHHGPVEPHVEAMERILAPSRLPSLRSGRWKLWGVRPENAPALYASIRAGRLMSAGEYVERTTLFP